MDETNGVKWKEFNHFGKCLCLAPSLCLIYIPMPVPVGRSQRKLNAGKDSRGTQWMNILPIIHLVQMWGCVIVKQRWEQHDRAPCFYQELSFHSTVRPISQVTAACNFWECLRLNYFSFGMLGYCTAVVVTVAVYDNTRRKYLHTLHLYRIQFCSTLNIGQVHSVTLNFHLHTTSLVQTVVIHYSKLPLI